VSAITYALISLASSLLGGGLVAVVLNHKIQLRAANRVDFDTVLSAMKQQRDEAWEHIERQDERMANMENEINGLRIARDLDPFPHWLIVEGRCAFVNRPFEERFLEPARQTHRDVIGRRQEDFWPEAFCRTLQGLDANASKRPDGTARAVTSLDVPGLGPCEVTVHRFPCRIRGVIVAYSGYFTAIDQASERIGRHERVAK
jgi:hypothetical protein